MSSCGPPVPPRCMSRRVRLGLIAGRGIAAADRPRRRWFSLRQPSMAPGSMRAWPASRPVKRQQGSDELLRCSASLHNDVISRAAGKPVHRRTDQRLAGRRDLVQNHPQLLPREFHDPRVAIRAAASAPGCRYEGGSPRSPRSISPALENSRPPVALENNRRSLGQRPLRWR